MGVVYRYRDTRLDRLVAVKALPAEFAGDSRWRDRFTHEARLVAALNHPNIATIHHVVEHDGADYLILEFVPGTTLAAELQRGPLPFEEALPIALQIGKAIGAGHEVHVIHRDVKPRNIMITPDRVAKLLDFGLAQRCSPSRSDSADSPTATAVMAPAAHMGGSGTPGYMSPEQIGGAMADERADIWAFGCVMYECLTGKAAFPGSAPAERIAASLSADPDWELLPDETPASIQYLLESCLRKDPNDRLSDIGDVCIELERVLNATRRHPFWPVKHNLSTPLTTFIRRDGEIEQLLQFIETSRLLTLTGPGGCGKSRLALELASAALAGDTLDRPGPSFPDGVWIVELASLSDDNLVPEAVASVLWASQGIKHRPGLTIAQALIEDLSTWTTLLILDNCEHLLTGCTSLIDDLLRHCPFLQIVATSREVLGLGCEQHYPVPQLSVPVSQSEADVSHYESVRLFAARATLARPQFSLTGENARVVAHICQRLEGMPLAIELAAARVRSLSVEDIASHLFEVLDQGHVLESSIRWSVALLTPPERTMLGRLSVFRGGWALETAEAVCGDRGGGTVRGRPVIELLSQLVDKSLVLYDQRADRSRYQLLETVRQYCEERLLVGKAATAVRQRHLDAYMKLTQEADEGFPGDQQAAWLDRLEIEHDNVRAAFQFSLRDDVDPRCGAELARNLHIFWGSRGYLDEGKPWLEKVLARRQGAADALQIQVFNAAGIIAWRLHEFESARRFYEQGLAIARQLNDRRRAAGILTNLGLLSEEQGYLAVSRGFHEQAMAVYRALDDGVGVAYVQLNLGVVAKLEHRYDEARRLFRECLPVFRHGGDGQRIAAVLQNLGEVAYHQHLDDEAVELFRESMGVLSQLRDRKVTVEVLLWLGVASTRRGDHEHAVRLIAAAEAILTATDIPMSLVDSPEYDGCLAVSRRHLDESRFAEAWDEGSKMTFDRAVFYALNSRPP